MQKDFSENPAGLGVLNDFDNQNSLEYDYSKFLNDGFEIDSELMKKFQPIAKKLNLSQDSVDLLLELALEMSQKQKAMYEKNEQQKLKSDIQKYDGMFKDDPELPKLNSKGIKDYMKVADDAYLKLASPKLKEFFQKTGLNYHPEIIKLFHTIGELSSEDDITYGGKPAYEELTPAQILYGKQ